MADEKIPIKIDDLRLGEALPGAVFLLLTGRHVVLRGEGDLIDRQTFDRLQFKKVNELFIKPEDNDKFKKWIGTDATPPPKSPFDGQRTEAKRAMLDIFQSDHPNPTVKAAVGAAKALAAEMLKTPYTMRSLKLLQNYSKGSVEHSVNVSTLSGYLGLQLGYTHKGILEHLTLGGLLHDVGKPLCGVKDGDPAPEIEKKMKGHSGAGVRLVEAQGDVPEEVKMIIEQHHECFDGSGFPRGARRYDIYDLARVVSIANVFDELVGGGKGTLVERQKAAILKMEKDLYAKFEPTKFEKAMKILRLGI